MQSVGNFFGGLTSSVSGAMGATGANSSKKNNTKVTGLGSNIAPGNTHVPNSSATGGMGTPSQRGGRSNRKNKNKSNKNKSNKNKSNKNKSNKNRNRKNKTRKNRSC